MGTSQASTQSAPMGEGKILSRHRTKSLGFHWCPQKQRGAGESGSATGSFVYPHRAAHENPCRSQSLRSSLGRNSEVSVRSATRRLPRLPDGTAITFGGDPREDQREPRTVCCFTQPVINKFIARVYTWRNRVRSHGRNERLELYVEKSTCTVLRGGGHGNMAPLTRPFRRGCRFGTLLVNLESRRVVDLLPDREVETSAAWMRQQLDLMVVSRDRGGTYASVQIEGESCRFRNKYWPLFGP